MEAREGFEIQKPSPCGLLDMDLSAALSELRFSLPAIMNLPKMSLESTGFEVFQLLNPGPADAAFMLAQKRGDLLAALEQLNHRQTPSIVFIISGEVFYQRHRSYCGISFPYQKSFGERHLQVIPADCPGTIEVGKGSILLILYPGDSSHLIPLKTSAYIKPLQLIGGRAIPSHKSLGGNSIGICRHYETETLPHFHDTLVSLELHSQPDEVSRSPDVQFVPSKVKVLQQPSHISIDVELV